MHERSTRVASDIGQTLADGGMHYFREYRGRYDIKNPATLAVVYDAFQPFPHVQAGFKTLTAAFSPGGFYTVRPVELQSQGVDWLQRSGFEGSDKVYVCRDPEDKMRQVLRDLVPVSDTEQPKAILVDDNARKLVEAGIKMAGEDSALIERLSRLAIVEFSQREQSNIPVEGRIHDQTGIHLFHLSSWEEGAVGSLIEALQNHGF